MARRDSDLLRAAGRRLAELREERGLTQRDLAQRLQRLQSYVAKLEQAEHRMDIADLAALAKAFEIDPGDLVRRLLLETAPSSTAP